MNSETVVLSSLIYNEKYIEKVLPYIKSEYFLEQHNQLIFNQVVDHFSKYKRQPTKKELLLDLSAADKKIPEGVYKSIETTLKDEIAQGSVIDDEWIVNKTEEFCKERALHLALLESIKIKEDTSGKTSASDIPRILTEALSVSFDSSIGYDYFDRAEERWETYHKLEKKVPFDIELLNKIAEGGMAEKTLTLLMAPTGVGKSLVMCHVAAAALSMGYNVLYITLEMSEVKISKRIDANLYNTDIRELSKIPKEDFLKKVDKFKNKTQGKLVVQEYPNNSAHSGHFRFLINELRSKKNFKPDLLIVDYIGICASSRYKAGTVNSYTFGKAVCEEIRELAQEFGFPALSAIQTNRSGYNVSDLDITSVSESIGGPMSADMMVGIVQTEEMNEMNQYLFIQLKNREGDVNEPKRFFVGVDKPKMRLYDVEESAQPKSAVFDNTPSGEKQNEDRKSKFNGIT